MSILTIDVLQSNSIKGLKTDLATAITAGKQPFGSMFKDGSLYCWAVITGSAQESISDMQDDIVTAQAAADAAAALDTAQNAVTNYTADGAISVARGRKKISKTSAAAMTLAAPAADGVEMDIYAGTAFAHVITATGLIDDGVTGGAKNTITLGAFVGACVTLFGSGGHWVVKSKTVATVA